MAITSRAINENYLHSLSIYIVYGLGFVANILILALLTAFSQQFLIRKIRNSGGLLEKIMATIILLVGLYLIYFGTTELSLQSGPAGDQGFLDIVYQIQGAIINFVSKILQTIGVMSR